ncbi:MAG: hypothetical protein JO189_27555 [Deltaproteobacteria bacterium]|nr:hypothetical protein [Deltaproteobacteria bacterium]
MHLTLKYAANVLVILALVSVTRRVNAQDQGTPSAEQPSATNPAEVPSAPAEGAQQAVSSMTGEQQSAATKALCSAIAGNYKDAAAAGASALTDPKVLLTAATSYSSVMHISVSSATSLLRGFALQHASEILTSCAASNVTSGVTSGLPSVGGATSGAPGIGGMPEMPKAP